MKKLPKILLVLCILLALVEFVPGLNEHLFYHINRPLSAVFFGLFLVAHIMSREDGSPDADHPKPGQH